MVIAAIGDCVEICFRRPTISRVSRVAARSVIERLSSESRKSPWRFGRVKIPPRGCSGAPTEMGLSGSGIRACANLKTQAPTLKTGGSQNRLLPSTREGADSAPSWSRLCKYAETTARQ